MIKLTETEKKEVLHQIHYILHPPISSRNSHIPINLPLLARAINEYVGENTILQLQLAGYQAREQTAKTFRVTGWAAVFVLILLGFAAGHGLFLLIHDIKWVLSKF